MTVHLWLIINDLALQQWRFTFPRERERYRILKMETQPEEENYGRRYGDPVSAQKVDSDSLGAKNFSFFKNCASYPFLPPAGYNL